MSLLFNKKIQLVELRAKVRALAAEIEREEQIIRMERMKGLGPHQRAVLAVLFDSYTDESEWWASNFRRLSTATGLNRSQVQRACKALRRLGLVKLEIGLWSDEGEVRGSGYRITDAGAAYHAALTQPEAA